MLTRRDMMKGTLAAGSAGLLPAPRAREVEYIAFSKPFQGYDFDELGRTLARLGFSGVELPVRQGGHIEPENAADELPEAVAALKLHGVSVSMITTSINQADGENTESVLRTAVELGVPRYRMKYYRYGNAKPILAQLDECKQMIADLADLNGELGIQGLYQNHSGAQYVGCAIWDLHRLIEDIPIEQLGVAFDLGHATVEGGKSWPVHVKLIRPHMAAIYVKDFNWVDRKTVWLPFGEGQVAESFYRELAKDGFAGPISVHVEYGKQESLEWREQAFASDLKTLQRLMS